MQMPVSKARREFLTPWTSTPAAVPVPSALPKPVDPSLLPLIDALTAPTTPVRRARTGPRPEDLVEDLFGYWADAGRQAK
jgi:hypothetical protein